MITDFERGVITGLVHRRGLLQRRRQGRSSPSGCTSGTSSLLRWVHARLPGSRLYGPYEHAGRRSFRLLVRGPALRRFLRDHDDDISHLCPHVAGRIERMREQYVWALLPRGRDAAS